jgi:hypothetical protein
MNAKHFAAVLIFSIAVPAASQSTDPNAKGKEMNAKCKPKDLLCNYIVATRQLLADYQTALSGQINTVKAAYTAIGRTAEQGRRDEIVTGLMNERNQRSEMLADDFIHGSKPIWHWKEYLLDYAAQDFQANRELLELESTDGTRFLGGVQSLEAEFSKVQTLDNILAGLNEKQNLVDHLKEVGQFAQQTKTDFDTLVCVGLKKDLTAKQASEKAIDHAIKDLQAAPASDARDKALARKTDEDKALTASIKQLLIERTSNGCKD